MSPTTTTGITGMLDLTVDALTKDFDGVREQLADLRQIADAAGRTGGPRFGLNGFVIVRDTEREAWAVAGALLDQLDPAEIASAQQVLGRQQGRSLVVERERPVGDDEARAVQNP